MPGEMHVRGSRWLAASSVALLALAGLVTGQAAQASTQEGHFRLSVAVLGLDGEYVDASVRLETEGGVAIYNDYDPFGGTFVALSPGRYRAQVQPSDPNAASPWWYGGTADRAQAEVIEITDHDAGTIVVQSVPAGTLSGTVTGPDGAPAGGVFVQSVFLSPTDGSATVTSAYERTDGDGHYSIPSQAPGDYVVRAVQALGGFASSLGATFHPQTPYLGSAQPVHVDAGADTSSVDIRMTAASAPTVERISGPTRYDVSAATAREAYPDGADTVFVASGANWPDALSAGPAADHLDAPLLITDPNSLPPAVAAEIERLDPSTITIVGGRAAVSPAVQAQLQALAPTNRIDGANRFEVSKKVMKTAFGSWVDSRLLFVTTGNNFPDALSSGAVAADSQSPVLLIDGHAPMLDDDTRTAIFSTIFLGITVVGGPAAVDEYLVQQLGYFQKWCAPETQCSAARVGGTDRFAVNRAVNDLDFETGALGAGRATVDTAYVVSGLDFPDALSATVLAAKNGARVYLAQHDCIPRETLDQISEQQLTRVVLVGGPAALGAGVAELRPC